jgi:hypothetical protein
MVLFTPITTVIVDGRKFSDWLALTPIGIRTLTIVGCDDVVDVVLELVVVVELLGLLVLVVVGELNDD